MGVSERQRDKEVRKRDKGERESIMMLLPFMGILIKTFSEISQ